jgi:hypothetical protein
VRHQEGMMESTINFHHVASRVNTLNHFDVVFGVDTVVWSGASVRRRRGGEGRTLQLFPLKKKVPLAPAASKVLEMSCVKEIYNREIGAEGKRYGQ